MAITKAQRTYLTNARDFGKAYHYRNPQPGGCSIAWNASRDNVCRKLVASGLLTDDYGITEAGRAALV